VAARRLLILMLVLLGTSTLAAALVPEPPERQATTSSTTPPRTSPVPAGGELIRASLDAGAKPLETVRMTLGDQLALRVTSSEPAQIEIRGLGLLEDVLPLSPARFDILATRPGRYEVRRLEPDRRLGVIEVAPARDRQPAGGTRSPT